MYDFTKLKEEIKKTEEWLGSEYIALHTGRATPAILDKVSVEQYGTKQPIKNVASMSTEDARTILISPWEKDMIAEIEKAISSSDIGLSAVASDAGVRVSFPELTGERREQLVKVVKAKLEDARIAVRKEREATWDDIQKREKDGEFAEDDKFRYKDELQKIIDEANSSLEASAERKEIDIKS